MTEKFAIDPDFIERSLETLREIKIKIDLNIETLKNGSTWEKFIVLEYMNRIAKAGQSLKNSLDFLRFGILTGVGLVDICEDLQSFFPEEGFVNNRVHWSSQPSCQEDVEEENDKESIDDLIAKMIKIATKRRKEKTASSKDENFEVPEFMLEKIESGEIS